MKKIILVTFFSFVGCNISNPLINSKGVSKIVITCDPVHNENSSEIEINKVFEIEKICTIINKGKREPLKFIPDYRLDFHYSKIIRVVLVKGNYVNMDGLTYELDEDLSKELAEISKNIL